MDAGCIFFFFFLPEKLKLGKICPSDNLPKARKLISGLLIFRLGSVWDSSFFQDPVSRGDASCPALPYLYRPAPGMPFFLPLFQNPVSLMKSPVIFWFYYWWTFWIVHILGLVLIVLLWNYCKFFIESM